MNNCGDLQFIYFIQIPVDIMGSLPSEWQREYGHLTLFLKMPKLFWDSIEEMNLNLWKDTEIVYLDYPYTVFCTWFTFCDFPTVAADREATNPS